ncbi:MAG: Na/Pi cotransporter family protein [Elusimicrobiota bacterium]
MSHLLLALNLLGALGVFLYGLKVMSEGLQKAAGTRLRQILAKATANRFSATLSGFLVTCAVQSSSATTVMVVGFCSAGLLTLSESLGIIFGANIGTTTTGWLVSLLGFKVKISRFAVPLIGIGFFSQFIRRWRTPHRVGEVLVGFGLLFLGLSLLNQAIPGVREVPEVMAWITRFSPETLSGLVLAVLVGAVLTTIFQSSSAMMAVTLTAAAQGIIDYPTAVAMVVGQNVGTTATAILASIGAPLVARRAALGHFLFNMIGVAGVVVLFRPFLSMVDLILPGDPYGTGENALLVAVPTHIAAFHTAFNVANTAVMLPLIHRLERLIVWILPESEEEREERGLVYISTPLAATPELAIAAAQKEVDRMAGITLRMIADIKRALTAEKRERRRLLERLRKDERTTDVLEQKINEYLASLVHGHLSTPASKETLSLLSMINDLERIGDHGEKMAILLERQTEKDYRFSDEAVREIRAMADKAEEVLAAMRAMILDREEDPIPGAQKREDELNALRDRFRKANLARLLAGKCSALAGVLFTDMLTSFEKMGDHAFNVVEACAGIK